MDHPNLVTSQLVIDKTLASLPRRKTDGAIIIRSKDAEDEKARVFKLNAVSGDPILLERCACTLCYINLIRLIIVADMGVTNGSTDFIVLGVRYPSAIRQRPHQPNQVHLYI
jgi:hypothetical protein